MATKYNGLFPYSGNFKMQYAQPLDNRIVCENTKDLLAKNTFGDINKFAYDGMIVTVPNDGIYYLKNSKTLINLVDNPDYIDPIDVTFDELINAGWQRITNYTGDYLYGTGITTNASAVQFTGDYYGTAKNINGALGWYVWKRVFIDENGTELLPNSNITITNVKLKYAPGRVLTSNNISIKFSDWQYFQKAFNNRSVVVSAINEPSNGINNYKVKYYQLTQPLKVVKVDDLYQFTYNNVIYNVAYVSNYLFKATSIVDSSKELECIAQVNTLDDLVKDTNFAVILRNEDKESDDGTYTVTFSVASPDDKFLNGTPNITSNNGNLISDDNGRLISNDKFIPTLNWNSIPTVAKINKCKLYLSNKQATIKQFTDNDAPTEDPGNLFTNLDNYTGELGNFSYTQNSHYTGNLIHESHEYKDGYNTMILEYQSQRFGDSNNTNIVKLFSGEYGDEDNNIRSWDTSLRVTTNPELGCVQIFNFSYAEGFGTVAAGGAAHAEGKGCGTYEDFSHVEGSNNINIGYGAHVEGWNNTNYGYGSHVEGGDNLCTVNYGHVEGAYNTVNGYGSHAEGYRTIASGQYQHVGGKWNIEDTEGKYAFIIGNGTTNERRSNAFTVSWNGDVNTNTILSNAISSKEINSDSAHFYRITEYGTQYITDIDPGSINLGEPGDGMLLKSSGAITTASDPFVPIVINNNLSVSSKLLKFNSDISGVDNPIHININEDNQNQPNVLQAKGWFIQGWSLLESATRKYKLWLGKEQKQFGDITNGEPTSWIKPNLGTLAKDDVLTIYNDRHWLNKLIVEAVNSDGTIEVKDISTPYDGSTALPPSDNTNLLNFRYGLFVSGKYNNKLVSLDTSKLNIGEAELTFNSFSLGNSNTTAGLNSVSFGRSNIVLGQHSIAVGVGNKALLFSSAAFGDRNRAGGENSFAAGMQNGVDGWYSSALGKGNGVYGDASFATGIGNQIGSNYQTVIGKYNKSDWDNKYAFIIGNGTADEASNRSNALTVDWNGNIKTNGNITSNQLQTNELSLIDGKFNITSSTRELQYIKYVIPQYKSADIRIGTGQNYIFTTPLNGGKCFIYGADMTVIYDNTDEFAFNMTINNRNVHIVGDGYAIVVEQIRGS
jgi:hypothetical protein